MPRRRWVLAGSALLLVGAAVTSPVRWLAAQAWGQGRLLLGRISLEEARVRPDLKPLEADRLALVPRIKEFGELRLGLLPTRNYETVNLDFDAVVWNVSACERERFESHVYHYPIVGSLPYTGFFDHEDALAEAARLEGKDLDVWVRQAGAYSSLGWFRDPLWRSMLRWDEGQLANTVLHELAHATVWLPDHGAWNESFASFVGDHGAELFLAEIAVERPQALDRLKAGAEDRDRYQTELHALAGRLEALYSGGGPRTEVLRQKQQILEETRTRWRSLPWKLSAYSAAMEDLSTWNNARIVQFRLYHEGTPVFEDALVRFSGDLRALLAACRNQLPGLAEAGGNSFDPFVGMGMLHPESL